MYAGVEVIAKLADTLPPVQWYLSLSKKSHSSVKGHGFALKWLQKEWKEGTGRCCCCL